MASPGPTELLFSAYRRKTLALLLLRPGEDFYVREISRVTGVPAGSLHRELRLLEEAGILLREPVGNQVRYQANRDCPIYPELSGIFRKSAGLVDVLRDALESLSGMIEIAFIFGSFAQGKERSTSDVDVLVIGELPFSSVLEALVGVHESLGREINPVVMPRNEVEEKLEAKDRFMSRIAGEPKLFVIGTESDFAELGKDRSAKATHA